jgi:L-rhamnose isomerase
MFQLTWTYLKASMRSKPIFERTFIKALQEREKTLNGYRKKYQVIESNKVVNTNSTP